MGFNLLSEFSIKIRNFKCFGDELQGFDLLKPINIIIGRNNSGKSSILDLIRYTTEIRDEPHKNLFQVRRELYHQNTASEILLSTKLKEEQISKVFKKNTTGGIFGGNHFEFGKKLLNLKLTWSYGFDGKKFFTIENSPEVDFLQERGRNYLEELVSACQNPLAGKKFYEINPDRDLRPEKNSNDLPVLQGNGEGFTTLIQQCINKASLGKRDLVENDLLNHLNLIFCSDAEFERILCQQLDDERWEIYLEEKNKGRISISQSGHGLKTILIVLCYVILVPKVLGGRLDQYIFAFEELENNLHPDLLRKLLIYLEQVALKNKCIFLLSTHSNVVIDLFSSNQNSQVLHVTHNGTESKVRTVSTFLENKDLLVDLGVKASDLLQANCIIWVEGPSDRIYINRWIELWSDQKLIEGVHYQCVFYGGGLRSHLSADDPIEVESEIPILRVNHNAIIVSDSDKSSKSSSIDDTKKRIHHEIENNGGLGWITKGRDIENYLSKELISRWLEDEAITANELDLYEDFFEYLPKVCESSKKEKKRKAKEKKYKKNFAKRKQLFALEIAPLMEKDDFSRFNDLDQKLNAICEKIRLWNYI
ncbi:hypothetical protein AWQ21_12240 [Picosynechococcus sp. PCC 7003]|uniref:ATP-dependent nuclease n=1 Tax=Picosynechococcus sp. PCC 7003 TaxID=374981 RepID=UPI0008105489|nr:AAA family ATPase [Picosynechococcus sp. PCC 7003]ANV85077.1 hypothetical protein AWQ21_12240 [Picosynechococcus sp. PCC 7003]